MRTTINLKKLYDTRKFFLKMKKERGELDVAVTSLLELMGHIIILEPNKFDDNGLRSPKMGVDEKGKDIITYKEDNDKRHYIFIVKIDDLDRGKLFGVKNSVREDLERAIFINYPDPRIEDRPEKVIVIAYNGRIPDHDIMRDFSDMIKRFSQRHNVRITHWDIEHLAWFGYRYDLLEQLKKLN